MSKNATFDETLDEKSKDKDRLSGQDNHILLFTLSYLSLSDAMALTAVSKGMKTRMSGLYWCHQLSVHFPHVMRSLRSSPAAIDYGALFKQQEEEEYAGLSSNERQVFRLVKAGDMRRLKSLIMLQASPAQSIKAILVTKDRYKQDIFDWAKINRHQSILDYSFQLILQQAAVSEVTINQRDAHGHVPIDWAVFCNQPDYVKTFLALGANVKAATGIGAQSLHWAAYLGYVEIVHAIVTHNPSTVHEITIEHETPLVWAARVGQVAVVQYLIQQGADLEVATNRPGFKEHGMTALCWAVDRGYLTVAKRLLAANANPTASYSSTRRQPLHIAAKKGYVEIVHAIVTHNPSTVHEQDRYDQTPLIWAASTGQVAVVQYLIQQGADLEVATNRSGFKEHGMTALCWAVDKGYLKVVRRLLAANANPTVSYGSKKRQPLHIAAKKGYVEIVHAIVMHDRWTVHGKNCRGETPLIWAASTGQVAVVQYLIQQGADLDLEVTTHEPNHYHCMHRATALCWAVKNKHRATTSQLLAAGANLPVECWRLALCINCQTFTDAFNAVKADLKKRLGASRSDEKANTLEQQSSLSDLHALASTLIALQPTNGVHYNPIYNIHLAHVKRAVIMHYRRPNQSVAARYKALQRIHSKFQALEPLFIQLNVMNEKADNLFRRGYYTEACQARRARDSLITHAVDYLVNDQNDQASAYQQFKDKSLGVIAAVKPRLATHRAYWKRVLANIVVAIGTAGLAHLSRAVYTRGKYLLFFNHPTDSARKVAQLETAVHDVPQLSSG